MRVKGLMVFAAAATFFSATPSFAVVPDLLGLPVGGLSIAIAATEGRPRSRRAISQSSPRLDQSISCGCKGTRQCRESQGRENG